jgi:signal transduction histidine kinase
MPSLSMPVSLRAVMVRLPRLTARRMDFVVVAVLLLWALPNVPWWWRPPGHSRPTPQVLEALAIALVQSLPFLWRRVSPVRIAVLMIAVLAVRADAHADLASAMASVGAAAYGIGAHSALARRSSRMAGLLALATAVSVSVITHERDAGVPLALIGAALVGGESAAAHRAETKAAIQAAASSERTRIARELHDVLAHQLSAIAVQAGAARVAWQTSGALAGRDPGDVLRVVEEQAREALAELGHMLGVLRRDQDDTPSWRPAPGLRDLEAIVESGRASGLELSLSVAGSVRQLPAGVDLAAYRIVQESVTNAARHAPGAVTEIAVRLAGDAIRLEVVNGPGRLGSPGPPPSGSGRGLVGMRERAELHGGTLDAGRRPDGGFAVQARLPFREVPR